MLALEERSKKRQLFLIKVEMKKTTKNTCQNFKITIRMEKKVFVSSLTDPDFTLSLKETFWEMAASWSSCRSSWFRIFFKEARAPFILLEPPSTEVATAPISRLFFPKKFNDKKNFENSKINKPHNRATKNTTKEFIKREDWVILFNINNRERDKRAAIMAKENIDQNQDGLEASSEWLAWAM